MDDDDCCSKYSTKVGKFSSDVDESVAASSSTSSNENYRLATSGDHVWCVSSHARPTYCNVCKDSLSGVAWHGVSCEICKIKSHKRCLRQLRQRCKWTGLDSVGSCAIYDEEGCSVMPHQWVEGNLPVSAKCSVCDRICGSMLRLQDYRCVWCRTMVHSSCKESYPKRCPLGACRISVLPPVAIKDLKPSGSCSSAPSKSLPTSPLLVLINTKSGDTQGVKFLRRFKQMLNPAQVYDLINGGPEFGLTLFQIFDSFRVLVCGGDGSVGWVLMSLDRMHLLTKCQVGVLPLGTGNDLARVLGWGNAFDDDAQLPQLTEKFERAHTKMLDRWSVLTYEGATNPNTIRCERRSSAITQYEDSVASHLSKILSSDDNTVVISSAKVLCETVKDFLSEVGKSYTKESDEEADNSITQDCTVLRQKLDNLLNTLKHESAEAAAVSESGIEPDGSSSDSVPEMHQHVRRLEQKQFIQREALMSRANSLKKAVRQIIEHAEQAVDEQNQQTEERRKKHRHLLARRFYTKKSSTPTAATARSVEKSAAKQRSALSLSATASSSVTDPESSSATPSPALRSEAEFSFKKVMVKSDEASVSGYTESDSTVPDDPSSVSKLQVPDAVNIQPPTPGNVSPVFEEDTARRSTPNSDRLMRIGLSKLYADSTTKPVQFLSFDQTVSDSELRNTDGCSPITDVKTSFSDGSLRDLVSFDTSPNASRKISSGSAFRLFDRMPSPQRNYLPSFQRGLVASGLTGGSLIAEVLLLNADVLGVAASPLMDFEDIPPEKYMEKKVMNNYFGIGLDAKIALEFHNKREECTDKTRSRSKLFMLYGMLGTKELLQRTYKSLEQRVHLECDGHRIQLPSLQGIVVLNIPSYQGGANFWGGTKGDQIFSAQSFDDKVLEVMAVFGVIHCATSRVIKLQNHRIAQCRRVKVIITGDEPIPVQVDGEAWMQPPGCIQIIHKNRAQVLVRNRQFEATLKTWTERLKREQKPPTCLLQTFTEDESNSVLNFLESFNNFVLCVRKACNECDRFENFVSNVSSQALCLCQKLYPPRKLPEVPHLHYHLLDALACAKQMSHLVQNQLALRKDIDLSASTKESLEQCDRVLSEDLRIFSRILTLSQSTTSLDQQAGNSVGVAVGACSSSPDKASVASKSSSSMSKFPRNLFRRWMKKSATSSSSPGKSKPNAYYWDVNSVGQWLDSLGLNEYKGDFILHDITGRELLQLDRKDLKELGVVKVGHMKRLQLAVRDLNNSSKSVAVRTADESTSSI